MADAWETVREVLGDGVDPKELDALQIGARAVLVLAFAVLALKLGGKRTLGRMSALDTMVLIVLGSMLSRAVNGSAPLFATLAGALLVVVVHELLAAMAFRWHRVSVFLKGHPSVLVEDGVVQRDAMRRAHVTDEDLAAHLRQAAHVDSPEAVQQARLERNGAISVVLREQRRDVGGTPRADAAASPGRWQR